MFRLTVDETLCKGCACMVPVSCFLVGVPGKSIHISTSRYDQEECVRQAVEDVINACPQGAVTLTRI